MLLSAGRCPGGVGGELSILFGLGAFTIWFVSVLCWATLMGVLPLGYL